MTSRRNRSSTIVNRTIKFMFAQIYADILKAQNSTALSLKTQLFYSALNLPQKTMPAFVKLVNIVLINFVTI
jgi:hypothetical protein